MIVKCLFAAKEECPLGLFALPDIKLRKVHSFDIIIIPRMEQIY